MLIFHIRFRFDPILQGEERNKFLDKWLEGAIEANGLQFGGGGGANEWRGFAELPSGESATEEHRRLVEQWFEANPEDILDYLIGPLLSDDVAYQVTYGEDG